MSFWKLNCSLRKQESPIHYTAWSHLSSTYVLHLIGVKGGKTTSQEEIEKWSCLSSNGPLNVLLIILEEASKQLLLTHTWECNGLKECQTLHPVLYSSNFGLLQSKFFSLLTAIKRPCCNLQKDLITVLKLKAFLLLKLASTWKWRRFSFQLFNKGGEKKDDEFQCSKNEMCCASFSFSASAFMFNRSKALLRLSSLLDCPSRPDRQTYTVYYRTTKRNRTPVPPWQIPLALSSIFAPIDRQEPLMNWMTTTEVGKIFLTEIWWALRLFVPTVVHHNFWGGGFAFCVLWCSCGLAAAAKPLWRAFLQEIQM